MATDVAARGIHVDGVTLVVHYDPPEDHKTYVHRSGRTARAGAGGVVVSMLTSDQMKDARAVMRKIDLNEPITEPSIDYIRALASGGPKPERAPAREPQSDNAGSNSRGGAKGKGGRHKNQRHNANSGSNKSGGNSPGGGSGSGRRKPKSQGQGQGSKPGGQRSGGQRSAGQRSGGQKAGANRSRSSNR